jgi:hypothetical protein
MFRIYRRRASMVNRTALKLTFANVNTWPDWANELRRFVAAKLPLAGAIRQDFRARLEGQQTADEHGTAGAPAPTMATPEEKLRPSLQ